MWTASDVIGLGFIGLMVIGSLIFIIVMRIDSVISKIKKKLKGNK